MNAVINHTEKKLDIYEVLKWLEDDGMVSDDNAQMLRTLAVGQEYKDKNALCVIAERQWIDQRNGHSLLTLEQLTTWLAEKVDTPYFRIDPLKIEVAKVTAVMSYAYAARFNILPVSIDDQFITVATSEPFVKEWENELSRINNKSFKRVIANPDDISRYLLEFYTVSKSVNRAESEAQIAGTEIGNLESLMELGRTGKLDANDQHVVTLLTGYCSMLLIKEPVIFILSPGESRVMFGLD